MNTRKPLTLYVAAFLGSLALVSGAMAQAPAASPTATVSWTAPTQYTDGVALPATDIASYTVTACRNFVGGTPCLTFKTPVPAAGAAPMTQIVVPLSCGAYVFAVMATTTASAHYPNVSSAYSNGVSFPTNVQCTANPPGGVTVTAGGTVTPGIG